MSFTRVKVTKRDGEDEVDVTTYSGDTLGSFSTDGIKITLSDGVSPIDLTGATIRVNVRKNKKSPNSILTFLSGGPDIDTSDLLNGNITLKKTAAQMEALKSFENYFWDVEYTLSGPRVKSPVRGLWTNIEDVSRA